MRNLHQIKANSYTDLELAVLWYLSKYNALRTLYLNKEFYYWDGYVNKWTTFKSDLRDIKIWKEKGKQEPAWERIQFTK